MKTNKSLACIAVFLVSLALLLTVIDICCFRVSFYRSEYAKNDTQSYTGMSQEDNLKATLVLLDYLRGKRDDIYIEASVNGEMRPIYNERETLHMVDVRALYQKAFAFRNIAAAAGLAVIAYLMAVRKRSLRMILRDGYVSGSLAIFALILFVGIWALADFDQFWTNFHLLFFDNDLWLLDPRSSIMINLFPGSFFFDLVIQIILAYLAVLILIGLFAFQPWRKTE